MPRTNKNKGKGNNKPLKTPTLPESTRQTPPIIEQLATPSPTPLKQRPEEPSRPSEVMSSILDEVKWDSDNDMEEEEREATYEELAEAFVSSREIIESLKEEKQRLEKHVEWFREQMEGFKLLLPSEKTEESSQN